MSWLSSLLLAALSGIVGLVIAGFIAIKFTEWFHVSSRDGGSGYLVVFLALAGGVSACALSLSLGFLLSRFAPGLANVDFFPALGIRLAALLLFGGAVLLGAWMLADFPPKIDGRALEVAIEVRCPVGFQLPQELVDAEAYVCARIADNSRNQPEGKLALAQARQEGRRWIVTGVLPLATSSANKLLDIRFRRGRDESFWFPLRGHPARSDQEWSQWIDSSGQAAQPESGKEQKFHLRYKVQLAEARKEAPTEDPAAQQIAEDQAKFSALGAETSIVEWFPYTQNGAPEERRKIALKNITARPNYASELAALMLDADDDVAKEALYLVAHLPQPQAGLLAGVAACGRDIAARIRKFNATPVEADPGYMGAASVSVRFSAWMEAVRALREKSGGDFTGELRPILELSRVRADSVVMRGDVCRVASFYMNEWAGLAPAAGDPAPR